MNLVLTLPQHDQPKTKVWVTIGQEESGMTLDAKMHPQVEIPMPPECCTECVGVKAQAMSESGQPVGGVIVVKVAEERKQSDPEKSDPPKDDPKPKAKK